MIVPMMGEVAMLVRDVMVAPVITVGPSATVQEVAKLFLEKQISAVPVLDNNGKLVGIVSEGDLLHRVEAGTERHRSWWLRVLVESDTLADEYVKSHSRRVSDVMTRDVITTSPQVPLHEVAALMEKNGVKRLPVLAIRVAAESAAGVGAVHDHLVTYRGGGWA
jgi:CBS domain-containing protein